MRPLIASLCILFFAVPASGCWDDAFSPGRDGEISISEAEISILFIGNSLTMSNDMTGMVAALLDSIGAGPTYVWQQAAPGTGLEDHWTVGGLEAIRSGQWDFVVLQQGPSATEGRPSLWEFAERFAGEIRAVGAMPALYMVWPAATRSFDFDGVSESYAEAARLANGVLLPAGDVWREAWSHEAALAFYGPDQFHPSQLGSFAAALTIAAGLSGEDALGFPHRFRTPSGQVVVISDAAAAHVKAAVAAVAAGISP